MADLAAEVIGVGYNTLDHVCVVDGGTPIGGKAELRDYFRQPGGQVPTALVALQRWGLRTAYVGPMGDDEGGTLQRASLLAEGVAVGGAVPCRGTASQQSFVQIDSVSGERTIQWYRPQALQLRVEDLDDQAIAGARALLLDGEDADCAVHAARLARRNGAVVMLDIDEAGPRTAELLAESSMVIVSGDVAQRLTGQSELLAALRDLCCRGPEIAVATLGAEGAVAWHRSEPLRQSGFAVQAIDTTSAGDVFHAGFLFGHLRGWKIEANLRFAAAAGALTCTAFGGRAAIPTLGAVQDFLGGNQ